MTFLARILARVLWTAIGVVTRNSWLTERKRKHRAL
jgi:hypothetical protein